jgi:NAD(P)-dependent dehydrogenase (short-subunit alcohol dehydrogenase family)
MPKTWFIKGASRGLGVAIAKAAMRAGDWICFEYLQVRARTSFYYAKG